MDVLASTLTGGLRVLAFPTATLFVLGLVVFVHEFGHFWVGRLCGVGVKVFSIGFGRELFGWYDRHGTRWRVSAIPLGGYVKFVGDMNGASMPDQDEMAAMSEAERRVSFHHQPLLNRAAIVAAGPFANFLLAIAIFGGFALVSGRQELVPRIQSVVPGSIAERAGFQPGDIVTGIDGRRIEWFSDLKRIVSTSSEDRLLFTVDRGGRKITLEAVPASQELAIPGLGKQRVGALGVVASQDPADLRNVSFGPIEALNYGITETWHVIEGTFTFLSRLIKGRESAQQLSGPIGIMMISGDVALNLGFLPLVRMAALMSVSIGLLNLFPVPLLDGGHLLFYAIEAIRGKPLKESVQEIGFRIGLALVVMLMLFVSWNDLVNLAARFTVGLT